MKYFAIIFIAIFLLPSCDEEFINYSGANDSVYFEEDRDLIKRSFVTTSEDEIIMDVNVLLTGLKAEHDRKYNITVVADSTSAVEGENGDYMFINNDFTISGGEISDMFKIKFLKQDYLKNETRTLYLKINDSDDLKAGNVNRQVLKINITDQVIKPESWPYAYKTFHEIKLRVFFQITELEEFPLAEDFNYGSSNYQYLTGTVLTAMSIYFTENEFYDENGVRITM